PVTSRGRSARVSGSVCSSLKQGIWMISLVTRAFFLSTGSVQPSLCSERVGPHRDPPNTRTSSADPDGHGCTGESVALSGSSELASGAADDVGAAHHLVRRRANSTAITAQT